MCYYIARVKGGKEKDVVTRFRNSAVYSDIRNYVGNIWIPADLNRERSYRGYVFFEIKDKVAEVCSRLEFFEPYLYRFLRATKDSSSFGYITTEEMEGVIKKAKGGKIDESVETDKECGFRQGDLVNIVNGLFSGFNGKIIKLRRRTQLVDVSVILWGRRVIVEQLAVSDIVHA